MKKVSQKDIDWLLNLNKEGRNKQSLHSPDTRKKHWLRVLLWILMIVGLGILPFFVLIRFSIYVNLHWGWNGWISLGFGILVTVLLLLMYVMILFGQVSNKKMLLKFSLAGTAMLVFAYCFYGVMYISTVNAKNEEIRQVYRSAHPILRVAVATSTLADGDLVITDIKRSPEDYAAMGIPLNERSLHFPQKTGYVHAIDLRTIGRNEFRNFMLRTSLGLMGLNTLRHAGTADHLHVSLPVPH